MIRRLGLPALVLALLAPLPSYAESWSSPDRAGDAVQTTYDEEPEPCGTFTEVPTTQGDITRLSVRHSLRRVVLTARVGGLPSAWQTSVSFTVVTPDGDFLVDLGRFRGRTEVFVSALPDPDPEDLEGSECGIAGYFSELGECRGARGRIDVAGGVVQVDQPRPCLGTPRWVRAGVHVLTGGSTWTTDAWGPAGSAGTFFDPVVGRRVRAGR